MKYEIGNEISGTVSGITKYGIFLKIDDEYTGMIHISEVSSKYVSDLKKLYVIGESVEAKIIEINEEKKQIKLSTKDNKRKKCIKEEGRGFEPLKEKLDFWVKEKLSELEKNQK